MLFEELLDRWLVMLDGFFFFFKLEIFPKNIVKRTQSQNDLVD